MEAEAYRAALAKLGFAGRGETDHGISEAARFFGVNVRTSQRWASGKQAIPKVVEITLIIMIRAKITPERVRKWLAEGRP